MKRRIHDLLDTAAAAVAGVKLGGVATTQTLAIGASLIAAVAIALSLISNFTTAKSDITWAVENSN